MNGCNTPAIADLDGDGRPEILAHNGLGGMEAFKYDPGTDAWIQLWHGHDGTVRISPMARSPQVVRSSRARFGRRRPSGSSLVWHGVRFHGLQIANALARPGNLAYPAVADLDRDGRPDMCNGQNLYRSIPRPSNGTRYGPPGDRVVRGLWDFGTFPQDAAGDDRRAKDGIGEIVVVGSGRVIMVNVHGRTIFGPVNFPAGSGGGPPTVGDFDGDGRAEFSAAASDSVVVFDPDCQGIPEINTCVSLRTDGILWHQVSQDHSSNRTGTSLFDFEGDGRVEVVYADEVFTRVYDGRTGEVLFFRSA